MVLQIVLVFRKYYNKRERERKSNCSLRGKSRLGNLVRQAWWHVSCFWILEEAFIKGRLGDAQILQLNCTSFRIYKRQETWIIALICRRHCSSAKYPVVTFCCGVFFPIWRFLCKLYCTLPDLPHKVKSSLCISRLHTKYFLLLWKIPEEIGRRSMLCKN